MIRIIGGTTVAEPVTFLAYSLGILIPLPLGIYLARIKRTRWGSLGVCFTAIVVAVMTLRLLQLWRMGDPDVCSAPGTGRPCGGHRCRGCDAGRTGQRPAQVAGRDLRRDLLRPRRHRTGGGPATTEFDQAPLAYALSLFSGLVYIAATVGLVSHRPWSRPLALIACSVELLGVLVIGTLSIIDTEAFPKDTVWSRFGSGYGYIPVILPVIGIVYLPGPCAMGLTGLSGAWSVPPLLVGACRCLPVPDGARRCLSAPAGACAGRHLA